MRRMLTVVCGFYWYCKILKKHLFLVQRITSSLVQIWKWCICKLWWKMVIMWSLWWKKINQEAWAIVYWRQPGIHDLPIVQFPALTLQVYTCPSIFTLLMLIHHSEEGLLGLVAWFCSRGTNLPWELGAAILRKLEKHGSFYELYNNSESMYACRFLESSFCYCGCYQFQSTTIYFIFFRIQIWNL